MLDRHVFRSNDQANVWGVVRERDGTVPDRVQVRLETADSWLPNGNVPVAVVTATPASTGMFVATLAVKDLPVGDYSFVLRADGVDLASAYARVGPIVKPAYRLELSARDRAVLSGSKIRADVAAEFFDGTPVAGVDLKVSTEYDDGEEETPGVTVRTALDGTATARVTVALGEEQNEYADYDEQWSWQYVGVHPTLPEEAAIDAATRRGLPLERSARHRRGDQGRQADHDRRRARRRLRPDGRGRSVRLGRRPAGRSTGRRQGPPADHGADPGPDQGGDVIRLHHEDDAARLRVHERTVDLGTRTVTTGANGAFRTTLAVTGGDRGYQVSARYVDEAGRTIRTGPTGTRPIANPMIDRSPASSRPSAPRTACTRPAIRSSSRWSVATRTPASTATSSRWPAGACGRFASVRPQVLDRVPFRLDPECVRPGRPVQRTAMTPPGIRTSSD